MQAKSVSMGQASVGILVVVHVSMELAWLEGLKSQSNEAGGGRLCPRTSKSIHCSPQHHQLVPFQPPWQAETG